MRIPDDFAFPAKRKPGHARREYLASLTPTERFSDSIEGHPQLQDEHPFGCTECPMVEVATEIGVILVRECQL